MPNTTHAVPTIADFSISNLKTLRGNEGEAFTCLIRFKGRVVADAHYDGWGGPIDVTYKTPADKELVQNFCAAQPKITDPQLDKPEKKFEMDFDDELLVDQLVVAEQTLRDKARLEKRIAKAASNATLYRLDGETEGWRVLGFKGDAVHDAVKAKAYLAKKYGARVTAIYGETPAVAAATA